MSARKSTTKPTPSIERVHTALRGFGSAGASILQVAQVVGMSEMMTRSYLAYLYKQGRVRKEHVGGPRWIRYSAVILDERVERLAKLEREIARIETRLSTLREQRNELAEKTLLNVR